MRLVGTRLSVAVVAGIPCWNHPRWVDRFDDWSRLFTRRGPDTLEESGGGVRFVDKDRTVGLKRIIPLALMVSIVESKEQLLFAAGRQVSMVRPRRAEIPNNRWLSIGLWRDRRGTRQTITQMCALVSAVPYPILQFL